MRKILIVGFGKMGKLYSKYIGDLWDYYDPYIEGGLKELDYLNKYDIIIISTPPEEHYKCYKNIRDLGFIGKIYIDKPVIINKNELELFNDKDVFCGMTERYNPVVIKLKKLIDVNSLVSIHFSRLSMVPVTFNVPVLFDLGIHDLDLYLYILDLKQIPNKIDVFYKSKTEHVTTKQHHILATFLWSHESRKRERKIVAIQKNFTYEANLIDQTILCYENNSVIRNMYIDKAQPLKNIMNKLSYVECKAHESHNFMLKIKDLEQKMEVN